MSVHEFTGPKNPRSTDRAFDGGSGGGYDDRMEARLVKLEEFATDAKERLGKIEARLDHTATKADVEASTNKVIIWTAGLLCVLAGTAITVMTFVLNNATPKASPPPLTPPAPIVIYTQPGQAAPPSAANPAKPSAQ